MTENIRHLVCAGVLAVLLVAVVVLAVAGVGAGAEWDVYLGAGTPIQDAIDGAGGYDLCACGSECGCGDSTGVRTADTKMLM